MDGSGKSNPIPDDELNRLAELYDKAANALDPFDEEQEDAYEKFCAHLKELHQEYGSEFSFDAFRRVAVGACRAYLRKNYPPDPTD